MRRYRFLSVVVSAIAISALVGPPTAQLRTLLRRIADVAMAPDEIALHRLIVGERLASPGLGAMFSEVIISAGLDEVT